MDSSNENNYGEPFTTKVIVLDTEASPDNDYLSEIAWIIYSSVGVAEGAYCATLVAPGYPEFARTEVLRVGSCAGVPLTKKQSTEARVMEDLAECVKSNSPLHLAAHNVEWDAAVIAAAERRTGTITGVAFLPTLCTLLATRRNYGHGHRLSLPKLHKLLFGQEHQNAHDALADAAACGECLWFLARQGIFRVANDHTDTSTAMPLLPADEYTLAVVDVTVERNSRNTGDVIKIPLKTTEDTVTVTGEPAKAGFPLFHNISITPTADYPLSSINCALKQFMVACGYETGSLYPLERYKGKLIRAKVTIQKGTEAYPDEVNRIQRFDKHDGRDLSQVEGVSSRFLNWLTTMISRRP
jgi:hypothetical protein